MSDLNKSSNIILSYKSDKSPFSVGLNVFNKHTSQIEDVMFVLKIKKLKSAICPIRVKPVCLKRAHIMAIAQSLKSTVI